MGNKTFRIFALLMLTAFLTGCIGDKAYRRQYSTLMVPPEPAKLPAISEDLPIGAVCENKGSKMTPARDREGSLQEHPSGPCIAYVEFNDQGKEQVPANGTVGSQTDRAVALIQNAIRDDPSHQPVVVAFIHGWKHNASPGNEFPYPAQEDEQPEPRGRGFAEPEDLNIQGFEHVLNFLYGLYGGQDCTGAPAPCITKPGHLVVGVFLSWRGGSISADWPVAQTLSLYSRGNAANRVGRGTEPHSGDMVDALGRISNAAHPPGSAGSPTQPMLVFVGHSFGGRILEIAMDQLYLPSLKDSVRRNEAQVPTFADLVIFINSAAPATISTHLLNYMANEKLQYRADRTDLPAGNGLGKERPLLLNITTPADAATGLLYPIAMGADGLLKEVGGRLKGNLQLDCFDPINNAVVPVTATKGYTKFDFYIETAAHKEMLQTHNVVDLGPPTAGTGVTNCASPSSPDDISYMIPGHCFLIQRKPQTCSTTAYSNNTPYWIMNTDGNIIPDHGTIFTDRLLRFIAKFLPDSTAKLIRPPVLTTPEQRSAKQQLR